MDVFFEYPHRDLLFEDIGVCFGVFGYDLCNCRAPVVANWLVIGLGTKDNVMVDTSSRSRLLRPCASAAFSYEQGSDSILYRYILDGRQWAIIIAP